MATRNPLCLIGVHAPGEDAIVNGKIGFAHCRRCNAQIVRRGIGLWRTVPKNMRIVWREPDAGEMTWPTQLR